MILNAICLEPVLTYSTLAIQQIESICHVHGFELDTENQRWVKC